MAAMATARRTQAERSSTTRGALLDAAIDCLVEEGYAGTTTSRVAERAGLSRGAHLHHFQTRAALVVAAVERLSRRRLDELAAAGEALPTGPARTEQGLDLLWAHYASPLFQAAVDLWSHGRTDEELRDHLIVVERMLDRQTLELARKLFPALAGTDQFEPLVQLSVATVRGLALVDTLHPGEQRNRKQWPACRERLAGLIDSAA
jgi:AcrR family transcriptional regulator